MSFDKASKANQKVHRERPQLSSRKHLGLLEKKKDYKERADDYHKKQNTLKVLKRRAESRNPDEFYFNMVKARLVDGVHTQEEQAPEYTPDQMKLMASQDVRYVNYKRSTEIKKIEKLKGSLHLIEVPYKPRNKHIIFCDSRKEAKTFNPDKQWSTDREKSGQSSAVTESALWDLDDETITGLAKETAKSYKELNRRLEREKQLRVTAEKMALKTALLDKQSKRVRVKKETIHHAAQYKWEPRRKR